METDPTNNHGAILNALSDIKASLAVNTNETSNIKAMTLETRSDIKELNTKVGFQNGRVTKLEEWSIEAKKIIENTARGVSDYKMSKVKFWTAVTAITILGGTIVTLAIMAIDNKIKQGIEEALSSKYDTKVELDYEEN